MSSNFSLYRHKYENISLERTDGVLEFRLHTDGGPFAFSAQAHTDLAAAFTDVGSDSENRVVILTGTGDSFCSTFDYGSFHEEMNHGHEQYWTNLRGAGNRMINALLDIEVPVIGAVNGPALSHSELVVLSDAVLATPSTTFQDATHFIAGIPPGDGMHTVWTTLLGANRGRYFLMSGEVIDADEAKRLGVVAEILQPSDLLPRARELAAAWASLPNLTLRGTRRILTTELRRLMHEQLHAGLTYEAIADLMRHRGPAPQDRYLDLRARRSL